MTVIEPFSSTTSLVTSINSTGQAAGFYQDLTHGNGYGFVTGTNGVGATQISPFSNSAIVHGINDSGQATGEYFDPTTFGTYGFVTGASGVGTAVIDPFSSNSVFATSINSNSQAGGYYLDPATGHQYGFLATPNASPVPEASTIASLGVMIGLAGLLLCDRKRRVITED